eukprot:CAMPEP_0181315640 /NCGR_PEP_ID=MMETSP1101-20121128/15483_1 /TAXON_ID=46948 /ORGANISM="Rhodomonas abbreviata, Strain Caron Lab Isolate" /LENGTH=955 /DNA_ID=CAMNT_0023422861 /DNA_START=290 /DNA_END=3157 /DNA_ORIENTATION=+
MTPIQYIREIKPDCRHCVWSLGYPLAIPNLMAISPQQSQCDALSTDGFSLCYLDCTKWDGDFDILDKDRDSDLNETEFVSFYVDSSVAPPQNYKLFTGGGLTENPALSRLDPRVAFTSIDLNKNGIVSRDEWRVFRHYWSPALVSRAGPGKVPEDGRPLADGPLGGFFIDRYFMQIWFKNMVNIMLEYYIAHSDEGFRMIDVREPVSMEKLNILRDMDLDGSERISNEETYFRLFADKNSDGSLSPEEYYDSLYKTECRPLVADQVVEADCPAGSGNTDDINAKRNFDLHDLDLNGKVSFLERKFVAADVNFDRQIDEDEWRVGDFPEIYGPFEGHCTKMEKAGGVTQCELDPERYNYYMSFHYCASQGSLAYNKPISAFPWSDQCELLVQVEESDPLVVVEKDPTDDEKTALEADGYLCYEPNDATESRMCYNGYAIQVFHSIATRLQWSYRPVLMSGEIDVVEHLTRPDVTTRGADNAVFKLALFTSYQTPWSPPDKIWCSGALWREDGLVVVKRLKDTETSIELAIVSMIIDPSFVNFVVFCYFVVLVTGHIFWFIESGENPLFDKSFTKGVMDGLWFSMVTVTTVGYGDIVPVTGIGKCLTILWMFFGILCFGVFSGSVSDQINTSAAENAITGVSDLSSFSIGVLNRLAEPVVQGMNLGADFNFNQVICEDIAACEAKLVNERSISAMIVPHSDILTYFKETKHSEQPCDKKMMVVGGNFSTEATEKWTGATVKMCSYSQSVYAARYLAEAVSTTMADLLADGSADTLMAEHLTVDDDADECAPGTGYNLELIIATCVVVFFYFILVEFMRWYRKYSVDKKVRENLKSGVADPQSRPMLTEADLEKKYGLRWLAKVKLAKLKRAHEKMAKVREIGAHDHIMHMVKRLRNMYMQQAHEIRNINHDTSTARERVSRLMTFMSIIGTLLVVTLFSVTIAMMVVWARLVRLTYL